MNIYEDPSKLSVVHKKEQKQPLRNRKQKTPRSRWENSKKSVNWYSNGTTKTIWRCVSLRTKEPCPKGYVTGGYVRRNAPNPSTNQNGPLEALEDAPGADILTKKPKFDLEVPVETDETSDSSQSDSSSFFQVTFWYPKWRSLNPWKGHLKHPKRSLGRTWLSLFSSLRWVTIVQEQF